MGQFSENFKNEKVVIIGGGPAGLTAAYKLSSAGMDSVVLEKAQVVGGISRTANYKGYFFDLGGHRFFTKIKRVEQMWNEVLGDDLLQCKRLSRILYNRRFFYYPLRLLNTLSGLGLWSSFLILASYLYAQLFPSKEEETFEQWVSNRFGERLYKTFFKTYTEKVWGIPCSEIRAEWAEQRIKGLSLLSVIKNTLRKQRKDAGNDTVIKTLIDSFHYPKLGPGMMWQAVAEIVQKKGSQVKLGAEVVEIQWAKNRVESIVVNIKGQKKIFHGTHFISSIPIIELVHKLMPPVPEKMLKLARNLKYRDFLIIVLIINKREIFPDNWIYIHDLGVKLGRIQNFKNWSPYMVPDLNKTCLGLEYFCFEGDDLWRMPDNEIIELGKKELETLQMVSAPEVEDGIVVRVPKAYPVYNDSYKESLQSVREFVNSIDNLQLVGRNGMHKYNNQDHSMLTGMLAVENILGGSHCLWEVNVHQEYHEEMKGQPEEQSVSDKALIRSFYRLDKAAFAVAVGLISGLVTFVATIYLIIKGGETIGPNLQLLSQYFMGYSITIKGSTIGAGYSFLWGFIFGWLFAYLRNFLLAIYIYRAKKKVEMLNFKDFLDHF